mmetsp:Transcript_73029/g.138744  ORF Transcript_73029/g.138744 Transcript_73029/m.138744 type:complete len:243 (-) Transcript_73029:499-1227(-)
MLSASWCRTPPRRRPPPAPVPDGPPPAMVRPAGGSVADLLGAAFAALPLRLTLRPSAAAAAPPAELDDALPALATGPARVCTLALGAIPLDAAAPAPLSGKFTEPVRRAGALLGAAASFADARPVELRFACAFAIARWPAALPSSKEAVFTSSSSCMRCMKRLAPASPMSAPRFATAWLTSSLSRPASTRSTPSASEVKPMTPPRWHTGRPSRDACSIHPVSTGRPARSRSARDSKTVLCSL